MDKLIGAVDQVFTQLKINRLEDWKRVGGRASVGLPGQLPVEPMWTEEELGLTTGTAPVTLRDGEDVVVDAAGAQEARSRFDYLLGKMVGPVQGQKVSDSASIKSNIRFQTGGVNTHLPQEELPSPRTVSATA